MLAPTGFAAFIPPFIPPGDPVPAIPVPAVPSAVLVPGLIPVCPAAEVPPSEPAEDPATVPLEPVSVPAGLVLTPGVRAEGLVLD